MVEVTGHDTGECLKNLESRLSAIKQQAHNKREQLRPYCGTLVNSETVHPGELTAPVKDGDRVDIVVFVAGDNSQTRLRLHG